MSCIRANRTEEPREKLLGSGVQAGRWEEHHPWRAPEKAPWGTEDDQECFWDPRILGKTTALATTEYASQIILGLLWERTGIKGLHQIFWFWLKDFCSLREILFCVSRIFYWSFLYNYPLQKEGWAVFQSNLRAWNGTEIPFSRKGNSLGKGRNWFLNGSQGPLGAFQTHANT